MWAEFEANETLVARVVQALDKLQHIIQNTANQGVSWARGGVTLEKVLSKARYMDIHPIIKVIHITKRESRILYLRKIGFYHKKRPLR